MTTFPRVLTNYRHRAELSQSELARRAGVDPSFVSYLEAGQRTAERATVQLIAAALRLPQSDRDMLTMAAGFLPGDLPAGTVDYLAAVIATARKAAERIEVIGRGAS